MSTATLLVRCEGPMQSWGSHSRFGERDTEEEPTKSGVVGLLAAALGRPRSQSVADLAGCRMAVRIDRPGHIESDYQTAGGVAKAGGAPGGTVLSTRYYLADASFLVALRGPRELLQEVQAALQAPVWPLYLGRRGYVPSVPPWVSDGLVDDDLVDALAKARLDDGPTANGGKSRTIVNECGPGEDGDLRQDLPLSFAPGDRRYGNRRTKRTRMEVTDHDLA